MIGIVDNFDQFYSKVNIVFALIFLFEMLLKIFGLGIRDYLRNRENLLEAFITITSMIDLAANTSTTNVFQTFRVMRVSLILLQMKFM